MMLKRDHRNRAFTLIEIIITLTVTAVLATMIYMYFGKAFSESVTPITRLRNSAALQRVMENIRADYNGNPKWLSGAVYTTNSYVIPTIFNGHQYKRITGGTSGSAEPNWPLNSAGTVTDSGITWRESGSPWTWRSGAAYTTKSYVIPTNFNGHYYKCTTGGTSGSAEPTWPLSSTGTVTDNSVTWTESGSLLPSTFLTTLSGKIGAEGSDQLTNDYGKNPDGTTYTKYNVIRNRFTQFDMNGIDQDSDPNNYKNILKVTLKNDNGETLTMLLFPY